MKTCCLRQQLLHLWNHSKDVAYKCVVWLLFLANELSNSVFCVCKHGFVLKPNLFLNGVFYFHTR